MWDVSLSSMLFWLLVTFAGIYLLNMLDGTNKWYRKHRRETLEGYRPMDKKP